jgi:hypothetical protein
MASSILYGLNGSKTAEARLKELCLNENNEISLMAVYSLLYLDKKEPFAETVRNVHKMEGRDYNVKAACMDFLGSIGLVPNNPDYRE